MNDTKHRSDEYCSNEYWQPMNPGTPWVCAADQPEVKTIFWICIVLFILAWLPIISPKPKAKKDENQQEASQPANNKILATCIHYMTR